MRPLWWTACWLAEGVVADRCVGAVAPVEGEDLQHGVSPLGVHDLDLRHALPVAREGDVEPRDREVAEDQAEELVRVRVAEELRRVSQHVGVVPLAAHVTKDLRRDGARDARGEEDDWSQPVRTGRSVRGRQSAIHRPPLLPAFGSSLEVEVEGWAGGRITSA